ncbi:MULTISPECIES: nucleoside triphosphate pyrophosphohydrolase [Segatella]|jgi:XTP/dITP diphosphohydrolase|uniref:MazG family protein n=2 Tax=Segatella TaxID=2974251 RepID=D8DWE8_9BACT|nr:MULTISPECIES: nucleoside triphosphate pyrophosphohydrolase [Segatella]MEE3415420.1 nucleoside triphosphate pyrophosphohydrolase [Prevotella sp.]EFI72208.1 MazG family protein [Segatella baroniae B14]OYP53431.1 nucleoside triphosphate pyrophosphohydrolase [Segatella bryantii]UKK76947.1 nucleoside triphosphate pyrophosphohydrolase [Segatella bryantii]UKK78546.1 nucleoside triphosphate pyrophosphohydrolase [Segatella baroniae B14]
MHTREEKIEAFGRLLDVQERLRKECPWDRKQTYESLRPNTIEEVFELCDALMKDDRKNISKELGDVMEHVMLYSIMGDETNDFDVADVCNQQADKLMFRHDFIDWRGWKLTRSDMVVNDSGQVVYRDELNRVLVDSDAPQTASQVESTWEQRKQKERDGNKTVLGGVPDSLPSLIKAYRIQDKARNVGFDWKDKGDVWKKVREELDELEAEIRKEDQENSTKELGDFLFSVINAARLYKLNPDNALESTNQKFISRFGYVEQALKSLGKSFKDTDLEEMDKLWNEAKQIERNKQ